jgi:predicted acetyltransferase
VFSEGFSEMNKLYGLQLAVPYAAHEQAVMEFRQILKDAGAPFDGCAGLEACNSYSEWLQFDYRNKQAYGDGWVPSTVFLGLRKGDGKLVGIIDIRHKLTDFLLNYGGQIGYSVAPNERRKGYAKQMLRLALHECKKLNIDRVLLTCDKENIASQKTITANGGVLENEVEDIPHLGGSGVIRRYWITTCIL